MAGQDLQGMNLIECELAQILIAEQREAQVVVLREKNGSRSLPIEIGIVEAVAINREVQGVETLRPMTHDLMVAAISGLGGRIARIIVSDLVTMKDGSGTFFGILVLAKENGEEVGVDCRPSDAIALAVRTGCQIYVNEKVLNSINA